MPVEMMVWLEEMLKIAETPDASTIHLLMQGVNISSAAVARVREPIVVNKFPSSSSPPRLPEGAQYMSTS
jgi:hypothetical protein